MHRSPNIDIDFLTCFLQFKVIDIERTLHACIVDQAIDFWVFYEDGFDEGGDGGDVAGV
jgi:hypothetical protein